MRKLLTLLILSATACTSGPEVAARADLTAEYPAAQIISTTVSEGDLDNAYVHVCFRSAPDSQLRAEVWLYQRRDGAWRRATSAGARAPDRQGRCRDET